MTDALVAFLTILALGLACLFVWMVFQAFQPRPVSRYAPPKRENSGREDIFKLNRLRLRNPPMRLCARHASLMAIGTVALLVTAEKCDRCKKSVDNRKDR